MRSLYTIALIVPIGLASYGNAQGGNPASPSGLPWCNTQPGAGVAANVPLPTIMGQPTAGDFAGIQSATLCPPSGAPPGMTCTAPINGVSYLPGGVDTLGDQSNVPCSITNNSACLMDPNVAIQFINIARAKEGLGNLILPGAPKTNVQFPDFYQYLTQDEKLVVLINLERQDRGLAPFPIPDQYPPAPYGHPGLTWEPHNHAAVLAEFYQLAQLGNNLDGTALVHDNSIDGQATTPGPTNRITSIPGFTQGTLTPSPAYEAETDTQTAENAVYSLLYQDGPSGWGHRHGLLGFNDSTSDHCATQIGAGFAASGNEAVYIQNQFNQENNNAAYAPPPTFFYVVDFVGQETPGWQLLEGIGLTPSPLAATVVYNPPAPGSPPPGSAPPPTVPPTPGIAPLPTGNGEPPPGTLSVYIGIQPNPFAAPVPANSIASVYVYPAPQWGAAYPPNVCPSGAATCPSAPGQFLGEGVLGSGGIECTPEMLGTLGTGWAVFQCSVDNVPSATPLVVIARDAYDQFVRLQPPYSQTFPLTEQSPIDMLTTTTTTSSSGVKTTTSTITPSGVSVTAATDSCGVAPLLPVSFMTTPSSTP
jgi:hypothetical protein